MPSKYVKQKNFEKNGRLIYRLCKEYSFNIAELNDGYQLRVNDILDLYPVGGKWHNLKTGERGEWWDEQELREVLRNTTKPSIGPTPTQNLNFYQSKEIAEKLVFRVDQQIRVVIKPKPRFLTEKMWLKLAAIFIYVERTQPTMSVQEEDLWESPKIH